MKKYVWLNLNTGKFSNSWDENEPRFNIEEFIKEANTIKDNNGDVWKLIEYTCLNDPEFDFNNLMKLH